MTSKRFQIIAHTRPIIASEGDAEAQLGPVKGLAAIQTRKEHLHDLVHRVDQEETGTTDAIAELMARDFAAHVIFVAHQGPTPVQPRERRGGYGLYGITSKGWIAIRPDGWPVVAPGPEGSVETWPTKAAVQEAIDAARAKDVPAEKDRSMTRKAPRTVIAADADADGDAAGLGMPTFYFVDYPETTLTLADLTSPDADSPHLLGATDIARLRAMRAGQEIDIYVPGFGGDLAVRRCDPPAAVFYRFDDNPETDMTIEQLVRQVPLPEGYIARIRALEIGEHVWLNFGAGGNTKFERMK